MRAYLIDPTSQSITEIDYDDAVDSVQSLIKAQPFAVIPFGTRNQGWDVDHIYIDDEGLLRRFFDEDGTSHSHRDFFELPNGFFIAGRGLLFGGDEEGNDIEPEATLDEVRVAVRFHVGLSDTDPRRPQPSWSVGI